jgi:hypothetical protein
MSVMCSRPSMPPRSTNAPYSVMFLTTPLTMAPSCRVLQQLGALFAHAGFDHRAARQHHVVALAVELDDLELEVLPSRGRVLDRTGVDQRTRQEGADVLDVDGEAALDLAVLQKIQSFELLSWTLGPCRKLADPPSGGIG